MLVKGAHGLIRPDCSTPMGLQSKGFSRKCRSIFRCRMTLLIGLVIWRMPRGLTTPIYFFSYSGSISDSVNTWYNESKDTGSHEPNGDNNGRHEPDNSKAGSQQTRMRPLYKNWLQGLPIANTSYGDDLDDQGLPRPEVPF